MLPMVSKERTFITSVLTAKEKKSGTISMTNNDEIGLITEKKATTMGDKTGGIQAQSSPILGAR
jgi:hypothetical protein